MLKHNDFCRFKIWDRNLLLHHLLVATVKYEYDAENARLQNGYKKRSRVHDIILSNNFRVGTISCEKEKIVLNFKDFLPIK